jgi:Protein of unknown function (DUF3828)
MMIILHRLADCAVALLLYAVLLVAPAFAAPAQSSTPQSFLEAIYKAYLGKDAPGIAISKPAVVRQYFVPSLAAAMIKDAAAAAKRSEVPELDGDPFVDAQDWDIADLKINVKMDGAAKAVGTVTFTNFREPYTVTLDLVKIAAGWRIADIKMAKRSLRGLYPG